MWDSPQGFPPNSSTTLLHCRGVRFEEKQCSHPCAPAPAAPSCRPAEQNFIDYFTPTNPLHQHSNPLHCTCVLAKANSQGGAVPSKSETFSPSALLQYIRAECHWTNRSDWLLKPSLGQVDMKEWMCWKMSEWLHDWIAHHNSYLETGEDNKPIDRCRGDLWVISGWSLGDIRVFSEECANNVPRVCPELPWVALVVL